MCNIVLRLCFKALAISDRIDARHLLFPLFVGDHRRLASYSCAMVISRSVARTCSISRATRRHRTAWSRRARFSVGIDQALGRSLRHSNNGNCSKVFQCPTSPKRRIRRSGTNIPTSYLAHSNEPPTASHTAVSSCDKRQTRSQSNGESPHGEHSGEARPIQYYAAGHRP